MINSDPGAVNDLDRHTSHITCLKISEDRQQIVSGSAGVSPTVFVWNAITGEKISRIKIPEGSRGISSVAISADNKYVAVIDSRSDQMLTVYEARTGNRSF